jgi:hypothetical protein
MQCKASTACTAITRLLGPLRARHPQTLRPPLRHDCGRVDPRDLEFRPGRISEADRRTSFTAPSSRMRSRAPLGPCDRNWCIPATAPLTLRWGSLAASREGRAVRAEQGDVLRSTDACRNVKRGLYRADCPRTGRAEQLVRIVARIRKPAVDLYALSELVHLGSDAGAGAGARSAAKATALGACCPWQIERLASLSPNAARAGEGGVSSPRVRGLLRFVRGGSPVGANRGFRFDRRARLLACDSSQPDQGGDGRLGHENCIDPARAAVASGRQLRGDRWSFVLLTLYLRVYLGAEEQGDVGQPQPHEEGDYSCTVSVTPGNGEEQPPGAEREAQQPPGAEREAQQPPGAEREARRVERNQRRETAAERPGVMIPSRRKRLPLEAPLMRIVATAGIIGIGVVIAAIMTSQHSKGWVIGLAVSIVSVALAAVLWSSRRL